MSFAIISAVLMSVIMISDVLSVILAEFWLMGAFLLNADQIISALLYAILMEVLIY